MRRSRLMVAVAALLVAACGGIPVQPPTHTLVLLEQSSFGRFVLLIYDETGLLTGATTGGTDQLASEAQATAHPERNEIELSWTGGACSHGPKLALNGDAGALLLELDVSPFEPSAVPVDCPAIGIGFHVTLTLSAPVTQEALTLKLLSR